MGNETAVAAVEERVSPFGPLVDTSASRARALAIKDADTYREAVELLDGIEALRDQIEEEVGPAIKKANDLHRDMLALRNRRTGPLEEAIRVLRPKMGRYLQDQEAERRRREAELSRQREEEHRRQQEEQARELEAAGDPEAAEVVREAPPPPPVKLTTPGVPKDTGISTRTDWKAEVTDLKALAAAVVSGELPLSAILPNATLINAQARALKAELRWPGVRVWSEAVVVRR